MSEEKKPRLPPGQILTKKFPVLQKGEIPHIKKDKYRLEITGAVENSVILSLEELGNMIDARITTDIHCVTTWSKFDTNWGGINFNSILELVKPKDSVCFVEFTGADSGFTTTVPIEILKSESAILALSYENRPISDEHGGPVRAVIPDLYFYKSAKWIIKIKFIEKDKPGYWENGGYSNKADPWKEQRYSSDD
jgi:DMSO/TMAO reductase YedYZ molybdopterin-dependent catalytic subunit